MTGNTLTQNPITGTNAYANNTYGTPQGFWGNTGGFGANTPFGYGAQTFQQQVPGLFGQQQVPGLFNQQQVPGLFNQQQVPGLFGQQQVPGQFNPYLTQMGQTTQQPGVYGQQVNPWQGGTNTPQIGFQGIQSAILQSTPPQVLSTILQTTPPQVLSTILQTTPPQVLPFILNALACQQVCQQVLQQNPQAIQGINPQAITQPIGQYGQGQFGIGGFGVNQTPYAGFQPQWQQAGCVGCVPGTPQWGNTMGFQGQGGFGQFQPQQPWSNTTYGTW
jgi:hypothetical protein